MNKLNQRVNDYRPLAILPSPFCQSGFFNNNVNRDFLNTLNTAKTQRTLLKESPAIDDVLPDLLARIYGAKSDAQKIAASKEFQSVIYSLAQETASDLSFHQQSEMEY